MEKEVKEISAREVSNKNLSPGRPKGAKNKTTLFKEAMRNGFESLLETEGEKVFRAVVDKALEGDMTAAKLIMDRIMPVQDVTGAKASGNMQVVINVDSMTAQPSITVMEPSSDEIE